ncbi:MAG: B12-binding domain-containing radical SAM protein [Desulfobacteraceae bacterium 4572_35.1]|nr:MAG: B12-binding domain-containing radical SAM protein [Desulfobacteraceae bacterium 4572_35.1]
MVNSRRILLVHPLGYASSSAENDVSRLANIMPPLGLAAIAAYLLERELEVDIIDCYAFPDSDRQILDYVRQQQPAWLGLSCTTSSFLDGVRIAEMVKKEQKDIQVVVGGPHVSALKGVLLEDYPILDALIVGEGEESFYQLLTTEVENWPDVAGVVCRTASGVVSFAGYRKPALDLDSLPFPAYHKLSGFPQAYQLPIFNYPKAPNTSCISSRGCPYACSYCDRSVFQRTFRFNSAQYLYTHMQYLRDEYGVKHINFYDDQFTFHRQRVVDFTRMMIEKPLGMTFNCAIRAEHVDDELIGLMKQAGCWMMSLGIETGDPDLLAQHRQNPDLDMLADTIRLIKKHGVRVKGLMMVGLPGETEQSIKRSMDYIFNLPIDDLNVAKFTPFPGSPLYENIHELGTFTEDWAQMDCMGFQFVTKGMTEERLEELFSDFYRAHFHRPEVLWGYVTMLWKSPHSWYRFIANLGGFLSFVKRGKRIADDNADEVANASR